MWILCTIAVLDAHACAENAHNIHTHNATHKHAQMCTFVHKKPGERERQRRDKYVPDRGGFRESDRDLWCFVSANIIMNGCSWPSRSEMAGASFACLALAVKFIYPLAALSSSLIHSLFWWNISRWQGKCVPFGPCQTTG